MANPKLKPCSVILRTREVENYFAKKRALQPLFEIQKLVKTEPCGEVTSPEFVNANQSKRIPRKTKRPCLDPLSNLPPHQNCSIRQEDNEVGITSEVIEIEDSIKSEIDDEIFCLTPQSEQQQTVSNSNYLVVHDGEQLVLAPSVNVVNAFSVSVVECSQLCQTPSTVNTNVPLRIGNAQKKNPFQLPETIILPNSTNRSTVVSVLPIRPVEDVIDEGDNIIQVATTSEALGDKRSYNKKERCIFCKKDVTDLYRHLKIHHKINDPAVLGDLFKTKQGPEKNTEYNGLRSNRVIRGNMAVSKPGKEPLELNRRLVNNELDISSEAEALSQFSLCLCCRAWVSAKTLCAHMKICSQKIIPVDHRMMSRAKSRLLESTAASASDGPQEIESESAESWLMQSSAAGASDVPREIETESWLLQSSTASASDGPQNKEAESGKSKLLGSSLRASNIPQDTVVESAESPLLETSAASVSDGPQEKEAECAESVVLESTVDSASHVPLAMEVECAESPLLEPSAPSESDGPQEKEAECAETVVLESTVDSASHVPLAMEVECAESPLLEPSSASASDSPQEKEEESTKSRLRAPSPAGSSNGSQEDISDRLHDDDLSQDETDDDNVIKVAVTKYKNGKRKFDKTVWCIFCKKDVTNFSRHLKNRHESEPDVKEIIQMKAGPEKNKLYELLRAKGNHESNTEVCKSGKGTLKLKRRLRYCKSDILTGTEALSRFTPCLHCKAWFSAKCISVHISICKHKSNPVPADDEMSSLKSQFLKSVPDSTSDVPPEKEKESELTEPIAVTVSGGPQEIESGSADIEIMESAAASVSDVPKEKAEECAESELNVSSVDTASGGPQVSEVESEPMESAAATPSDVSQEKVVECTESELTVSSAAIASDDPQEKDVNSARCRLRESSPACSSNGHEEDVFDRHDDEDESDEDGNMIKVDMASRHEDGTKKFDKRDRCIFCKKNVTNFSRHIKARHKKEPVVQEILQMKAGPERNKLYDGLRAEGIHDNNVEVCKLGKGTLKVKRRLPYNELDIPTNEEAVSRFTPCAYCRAWVSYKNLCLHMKKCSQKTIPISGRAGRAKSRHMKSLADGTSNSAEEKKAAARAKRRQLKSAAAGTSNGPQGNTSDQLHGDTMSQDETAKDDNVIKVAVTRYENGKRKFDRKDSCIFCKREVSNFSRHLHNRHSYEPDVQQIIQMKPGPEKNKLYDALRTKGMYYNNAEVCKTGRGTLKLKRRLPHNELDIPTGTEALSRYTPCLYCKAWVSSKGLCLHMKRCKQKTVPLEHRKARSKSQLLKLFTGSASDVFQEDILSRLREDPVSQVILQDNLIIEFGQYLFEGCSQTEALRKEIRSDMRDVSRLLIAARELSKDLYEPAVENLVELIDDTRGSLVIAAVKMVAGEGETEKGYRAPAMLSSIGTHLRKIVQVLEDKNDNCNVEKLSSFKRWLEKDYAQSLGTKAKVPVDKNIRSKKLMKLPSGDDLKVLHVYIEEHLSKASDQLAITSNKSAYLRLAILLQAKLLLLNCRSVGDVENVSLHTFVTRDQIPLDPDVVKLLPVPAQVMVDQLQLIDVPGRRNSKIPVIFTNKMVSDMNLLIANRGAAGVLSENNYLFGMPESSLPMRPGACLKKVAAECNAEFPQYIRTPYLRNHLASMFQLFELTDSQVEQVAKLVFHDLEINPGLFNTAATTTRVSALLLAMEKIQAENKNKYKCQLKMPPGYEVETDDSDDEYVDVEHDLQMASVGNTEPLPDELVQYLLGYPSATQVSSPIKH